MFRQKKSEIREEHSDDQPNGSRNEDRETRSLDIYRDLLTQVKQKTERKVRKKRKLTDLLINRSLDFSIGPLERL